jgi:serine/threonine-protein kinase
VDVAKDTRFCSQCGTPIPGSDDMATLDFAPPRPPGVKPSPRPVSGSAAKAPSSAEYVASEGRFLPGRLIAGRYRIIALLGRGGMGEVYRADDLTLGQPVALKFLPDEAAQDEALLERFRNEVRIARKVSHPNVCRVYDVGEVEGHTFFTMEYVDGEDLASLLRRIGRLPPDKAVEIARHLCAGLAAAHAKGVLHRDLKPANIMLDGRGQVVITDFGLAGLADNIRGAEIRSGTPAYMAPEQLAGKEVTVRSDIFSLGLVLYEVFTGKRAFAEKPQLVSGGGDHTPSRPSSVVKDLDPIVERVILRCMETDPALRPASALAVAAALPGGDPLAAALAAGETPSPQLVAASGETAGLRPAIAMTCFVAVLAGLAISIFLSIRYSGLEKMRLERTPEVLERRAREILANAGYAERPADRGFGFSFNTDFRDYVEKQDRNSRPSWDEVLAGRPAILEFWYRQSPKDMSANGFYDGLFTPGLLQPDDPPTVVSGMANVRLDPQGRLIDFLTIPPQKSDAATSASQPDWHPLFAAAEIDPAKLQAAQPQWNSLGAADVRAAWTGTWPGTRWPLRVEAGAWRGKPVYFSLLGDWTKPERMVARDSASERKRKISQIIVLALFAVLLAAGARLARRNYRQGRGDREGALRLAIVMFGLAVLLWLCRTHFVAGLDMFGSLMLCIATGVLAAGITWMLYLALEPLIRRRWPHAIISWSRLLSGQWRDPLVGRDVLFGVAFGVVWLLIVTVGFVFRDRIGAPPQLASDSYLLGGRQALGQWLVQIPGSINTTIVFFFLILGLKVLLRKDWLAAPVFVAIFVVIQTLQSSHLTVDLPVVALIYLVLALVVFRVGLVPLAVGAFTVDMLANVPFTADFSAWYLGSTLLALLSVVALAAWGFYQSLGGQPLLKLELEAE